MSTSAGALSGVRVIDLATNAVAYTSRLLADLGAEVIRVEPPNGALRQTMPIRMVDGSPVSCAHAFWNANKRGITLDLEHADGRKLFSDLIARSDVVIETFAPGTLAGWGLGYDDMQRRNPGIILVSVTPFGQNGPRAQFRATDLTLLAAGGLLSLGGYPETGPVAVPGEQGHLASAIFGAVAALKALVEREGTHHGQWIDVSGQECIAFALEDAVPEWYLNGTVRKRTGDKAREAGTGVYPCKDGHISMVAGRLGTAKAFKTLCHWVSESGVADGHALLEERWQDFKYRQSSDGIDRFAAIFGAFCATRSKQELYREGQARQIAIAPVNSVADVLANEQLLTNNYFQPIKDPALRTTVKFPGPPYRLAKTPAGVRAPAPMTGEHNQAVYRGTLGLNEDELRCLTAAGVV